MVYQWDNTVQLSATDIFLALPNGVRWTWPWLVFFVLPGLLISLSFFARQGIVESLVSIPGRFDSASTFIVVLDAELLRIGAFAWMPRLSCILARRPPVPGIFGTVFSCCCGWPCLWCSITTYRLYKPKFEKLAKAASHPPGFPAATVNE